MASDEAIGLIMTLAESLTKSERNTVIAKLNRMNIPEVNYDRLKQAEERCAFYSEIIQEVTGVWPISKSRGTIVVYCKRVLAKLLKDEGFTFPTIGKVMGLDHSTIVFHCKEAKTAEKYPSMFPEYNNIKKAVLDKLKDFTNSL